MSFTSTKILELGSCAFRQPKAESHCRFLHGYRLTAKFWFKANQLNENNWVVDFGSLDDLKKVLRNQFDHTTVIDVNDPYIDDFKRLEEEGVIDLRVLKGVGIEKFAEYCFKVSDKFIKEQSEGRCWVDKVEVFEHENNSAIYTENIVTTMRFADHTEEDNG
jgi:6-pyruvoyltetrahydropterin/6-carboxytetrahydropterin synthase|tara:strand:- start:277 stop:762 length:486 start_codon:yes stop_codon:yes gene_type:complete